MRTALARTRRSAGVVAAAAGLAGAMITGAAVPAAASTTPGVYGWGINTAGQVGNGTTVTQATPEPLTLPASVAQISAGGWDSAAVLANGTVAAWGENLYGQVGVGPPLTDRLSPVVVPGLTGITQVAIGYYHMLAVDSGGTVWSWGSNPDGQLGNGTTSTSIGSNPTPVPVPGLTGITQVAAGQNFSLALRSDGTVWAWGDNQYGELGDGTTTSKDRPEQVPGLTGITEVIAGLKTSYAIGSGGTLLAWGNNSAGLLGNGTSTGIATVPAPVPGLTGVTSVASNSHATLAIAGPADAMWSWGENDSTGAAGDGTTIAHYSPHLTNLTGVTQVSEGLDMGAAVLSSDRLMTWGYNYYGGLGNGATDSAVHATPAPVLTGVNVTKVALGVGHALAFGTPLPRVPSVIGLTQSDASSVLQAAGYVLGRVAYIVDLTCNYIGEVKTQNPAAGTIAQPGTAVSVGIGKPGGKCL